MKRNSITQIYYNFVSGFDNKADSTIDFYNQYALYLNNIKTFNTKEELKFYIEITCQYVNALYQKGRFNSVADHVEGKIILINNEILKLDASELKDSWYCGILCTGAMAYHYLRDYKKANQIFKSLTDHDPQNELYKQWESYSAYGLKIWIIRMIAIISFILCTIVLFFGRFIPNPTMRLSILIGAFIALISLLSYESYIKRSYRKSTAN